MSERKSINRYYPPDVDPSKVKFSNRKTKKDKNGRPKPESVRLMAPFSMKCLECKEYIAQSRKFNARKTTTDRDYLGIKILKFSLRCPRCYGEMVFETDPKNGDYKCVSGCKKNYERSAAIKENESIDEMINRLEKEVKEDERMKKMEQNGGKRNGLTSEETGMEQLEKRLIEQQKEKERIEELEEIQEHMRNLDQRRSLLDEVTLPENTKSENDASCEHNNDDSSFIREKLDSEAKKAFEDFKKTKGMQQTTGISKNEYLSSPDEEKAELQNDEKRNGLTGLKRSIVEPFKGIKKRKKTKIIS